MSIRNYTFLILLLLFPIFSLNSYGQSDQVTPQGLSQEENNRQWWNKFGDPTLLKLIELTVNNNSNLLNAINNIEIARRELRVSQSGFYPTLTLSSNYTIEKTSEGITHVDQRDHIGSATVSMNWEIDLFGSIRKGAQSQRQYYYASKENYRAVMVSIVSQLATNYSYLRTYQQNLRIAQQNLISQAGIMKLTENKYTLGLASKLDYLQAKSLYLQTKASLPALESDIRNQIDAISVLVGEFSDTLAAQLNEVIPLTLVDTLPVEGIPAELIRRRPDILAAEMKIEAQAKAVGATKADWWPKFFIDGSFGYGSNKFRHFTNKDNMTWQVVPSMQWTIFSGRATVEQTRIAQLKLDETINNFNYNVLTAIQEVDGAIYAYNYALRQLVAMEEALVQVQETYKLAIDLYDQGLASYQNVLDTQKSLLSMETGTVSARSQALIYYIQLYKALGGGW